MGKSGQAPRGPRRSEFIQFSLDLTGATADVGGDFVRCHTFLAGSLWLALHEGKHVVYRPGFLTQALLGSKGRLGSMTCGPGQSNGVKRLIQNGSLENVPDLELIGLGFCFV